DYDEALRLDPQMIEAYSNRAHALKNLGRFSEAITSYQKAIDSGSASPQAYNDAAWLLATCPVESVRDPGKAVEHAQHACERSHYRNGDFLDTLAAAHAANGDFDAAVKAQQQALTLLPEPARIAAGERL